MTQQLILLTLPACFSVDVKDGDFRCGENDACPTGFVCAADKFCRASDDPGGSGGGGPVSTAFAPSNFDASLVTSGRLAFRPTESIRIDSDTGTITTLAGQPYSNNNILMTRMSQPNAPYLMVFSLATLEIPAGVSVRIDGKAAFAFAVDGDVTIAGALDASASAATPGPGGFAGVATDHADGLGPAAGRACPSTSLTCGGGGAGNIAVGGNGGPVANNAALGAGGIAGGSMGTPLIGGSSGGTGTDDNGTARSGAGGGALQITAFGTLTIDASGVIDVGGGAGDGGSDVGGGGSGGGAGGLVLLEADQLAIAGTVAANGGGGGGGSCGGKFGGAGQAARSDAVPAAGGLAADTVSSAGGAGGAGDAAPGGSAKPAPCAGGGGGGAGGRVRLRARQTTTSSARALSPTAGIVGEELP